MRKQSARFTKGSVTIRGDLFVPRGEGPFPLIIYSHGYGYAYSEISLERLAQSGIACCFFDFRGGSPHSRSGGRSLDMSVLTEADDLEIVLDALKQDARFDKNRIALAGNSQGGYVSAIVGIRRRDEIADLFLLCPAFVITDFRAAYLGGRDIDEPMWFGNMAIGRKYVDDSDSFHVYDRMKEFTRPVIIYHGTADNMAPISYSRRAVRAFPDATLDELPGVGHMVGVAAGHIEDDIIKHLFAQDT